MKSSFNRLNVSANGVTNIISKVLVGTIGDYAPMQTVEDTGPTLGGLTNYPPAGGVSEGCTVTADFTAYYELTNMPAIWIEPVLTNVCVNYGNVNFSLSANSKAPSGVSWLITPTNGVTLTGYSTYSVVNVGTMATSYVIRATSYDNTNIFGLAVLNVLKVDMTAYRPMTDWTAYGNPFQKQAITNSQEENPGAGIRVNGDDDNNNSTADSSDTMVSGENDLIEVELKAEPYPASGLTYILKRSNSIIKVWNGQSKGTALLDSGTEAEITFSASTKTVWIENPSGGSADLEFIVRSGETDICSDKIHFYPFTSIVIVFGGKDQTPSDPPDANFSAFVIATNLYHNGYDVHIYDEENSTDANTEVDSAVAHRSVSGVAVVGYSWGGDASFDVVDHMNGNTNSFTIRYTAYIDAVNNPYDPFHVSQDQRPTNTLYHANYYQRTGYSVLNLRGDAIVNPPGANSETNLTAEGVTHVNIDDLDIVRNGIFSGVTNQVDH
jgi:hypothetical protein